MMKTRFLSLFLLLLTTAAFGQTPSIQVSVSDTIMLPANIITIFIGFEDGQQQMYDDEGNYNPLYGDFTEEKALVQQILNKKGVKWKDLSEMGGLYNNMDHYYGQGADQQGMVVTFHSTEQLQMILPEVKAIPNVMSEQMGVEVDRNQVDLMPLYDKLLSKAKEKAGGIARLSGRKIGNILHIIQEEPSDGQNLPAYLEDLGYMSRYLMGGLKNEAADGNRVAVKASMKVTFELK